MNHLSICVGVEAGQRGPGAWPAAAAAQWQAATALRLGRQLLRCRTIQLPICHASAAHRHELPTKQDERCDGGRTAAEHQIPPRQPGGQNQALRLLLLLLRRLLLMRLRLLRRLLLRWQPLLPSLLPAFCGHRAASAVEAPPRRTLPPILGSTARRGPPWPCWLCQLWSTEAVVLLHVGGWDACRAGVANRGYEAARDGGAAERRQHAGLIGGHPDRLAPLSCSQRTALSVAHQSGELCGRETGRRPSEREQRSEA